MKSFFQFHKYFMAIWNIASKGFGMHTQTQTAPHFYTPEYCLVDTGTKYLPSLPVTIASTTGIYLALTAQ